MRKMVFDSAKDQEDFEGSGGERASPEEQKNWQPSIVQIVGLFVFPLIGPVSLLIFPVESDVGELFVVIFNPVLYLVVGMVLSSFATGAAVAVAGETDIDKMRRRVHDFRIASLFFLALSEAAAAMFIVGDNAPLSVFVVALGFYLLYGFLGVFWIWSKDRVLSYQKTIAEDSVWHRSKKSSCD